jgi:hypothetical protein
MSGKCNNAADTTSFSSWKPATSVSACGFLMRSKTDDHESSRMKTQKVGLGTTEHTEVHGIRKGRKSKRTTDCADDTDEEF